MSLYVYPRIRDLREDADWTQEQVAKMLGKQTTTYRRWESGETEIPAHIIKKLCEIYDVSADYMLGFSNEKRKLPKI